MKSKQLAPELRDWIRGLSKSEIRKRAELFEEWSKQLFGLLRPKRKKSVDLGKFNRWN